jgi:hypothetical protein
VQGDLAHGSRECDLALMPKHLRKVEAGQGVRFSQLALIQCAILQRASPSFTVKVENEKQNGCDVHYSDIHAEQGAKEIQGKCGRQRGRAACLRVEGRGKRESRRRNRSAACLRVEGRGKKESRRRNRSAAGLNADGQGRDESKDALCGRECNGSSRVTSGKAAVVVAAKGTRAIAEVAGETKNDGAAADAAAAVPPPPCSETAHHVTDPKMISVVIM